jgi:WD40 repeat protein
VAAIVLAPDGRRLYTAEGRLVHVWELPGLRLVRSLRGHGRVIRQLAISPDGKHLASGGEDTSVKVWDLTEPDPQMAQLLDADSRAVAVGFSPDDRLLATGGRDTVVRVWDLAARRQRFEL